MSCGEKAAEQVSSRTVLWNHLDVDCAMEKLRSNKLANRPRKNMVMLHARSRCCCVAQHDFLLPLNMSSRQTITI